jgi:hypothetical protein
MRERCYILLQLRRKISSEATVTIKASSEILILYKELISEEAFLFSAIDNNTPDRPFGPRVKMNSRSI